MKENLKLPTRQRSQRIFKGFYRTATYSEKNSSIFRGHQIAAFPMPVNKAAYLRHEIIDQCLRNARFHWSKDRILNCINSRLTEKYGPDAVVSEATLRNDLRDMETEYGAPIETYKKGRSNCYKYEDKDFSIKNLPVNNDDLAKLNLAVHILQQINGFVLADEIEEVVSKLEKKLKVSSAQKASIAFANPPVAQGTENLGDIYEAIINHRVLKIAYQHFKANEPVEQVIHPYFLKEFNNRWFLFGWSDQNSRIEIMALDRMVKIKVTSGEYKDNCFDPETYFAHLIGVTDPGTEPEKVVLCFSKERAPYVTTRKIHHTQKEKTNIDGTVMVTLQLKINRELVALILGYGDDVEVKEPERLRAQIQSRLEKAAEHYKVFQ